MAAIKKYNWDGLFERDKTTLVRGVDYHCSQSTMAGMIRNHASKRAIRVKITDTGDTLAVEITGAIPRPDKTAQYCEFVPSSLATTNRH